MPSSTGYDSRMDTKKLVTNNDADNRDAPKIPPEVSILSTPAWSAYNFKNYFKGVIPTPRSILVNNTIGFTSNFVPEDSPFYYSAQGLSLLGPGGLKKFGWQGATAGLVLDLAVAEGRRIDRDLAPLSEMDTYGSLNIYSTLKQLDDRRTRLLYQPMFPTAEGTPFFAGASINKSFIEVLDEKLNSLRHIIFQRIQGDGAPIFGDKYFPPQSSFGNTQEGMVGNFLPAFTDQQPYGSQLWLGKDYQNKLFAPLQNGSWSLSPSLQYSYGQQLGALVTLPMPNSSGILPMPISNAEGYDGYIRGYGNQPAPFVRLPMPDPNISMSVSTTGAYAVDNALNSFLPYLLNQVPSEPEPWLDKKYLDTLSSPSTDGNGPFSRYLQSITDQTSSRQEQLWNAFVRAREDIKAKGTNDDRDLVQLASISDSIPVLSSRRYIRDTSLSDYSPPEPASAQPTISPAEQAFLAELDRQAALEAANMLPDPELINRLYGEIEAAPAQDSGSTTPADSVPRVKQPSAIDYAGSAIGTAYNVMSFGSTLQDVLTGRRSDPGAYLSLANSTAQGLNWLAKTDGVKDIVSAIGDLQGPLDTMADVTGGAMSGWGLYQNIAGLANGEVNAQNVLGAVANAGQLYQTAAKPLPARALAFAA